MRSGTKDRLPRNWKLIPGDWHKITARAGLHGVRGVRDRIARPDLGLSVQKQWMDWFNGKIYPKLWFLAPNWLGRVHHWLAFTLGKKRHKNKWPNPLHHSQDTLGPGSGTWEGRGWRGLVSSKLSGANDQLCSPSYLLSRKLEILILLSGHQILYPLVMSNIAIENDHRNSGFSH